MPKMFPPAIIAQPSATARHESALFGKLLASLLPIEDCNVRGSVFGLDQPCKGSIAGRIGAFRTQPKLQASS